MSKLCFTRRELMEHSGWTKTRLHIHFKELVEAEYVVKSGKRDGQSLFHLVWDGSGMNGEKFLLGLNS